MPDRHAAITYDYRVRVGPIAGLAELEHGANSDDGHSPKRIVVGTWHAGLPDVSSEAEAALVAVINGSHLSSEWRQLFEDAATVTRTGGGSAPPVARASSTVPAGAKKTANGSGMPALMPSTATLVGAEMTVEEYLWYIKPPNRWAAISTGTIRSVLEHEGFFTIVASPPHDANAQLFRRSPRSVATTLVTLATLAYWVVEYHRYAVSSASGYAVIRAFASSSGWPSLAAFVVFSYLVLHHLRMYFGVEFAATDRTFQIAKRLVPEEDRDRKRWAEAFLMSGVVACSTLLPTATGSGNVWFLILLLLAQFILARLYLRLFRDEFREFDEERTTNMLLSYNDYTFFLTILAVTLVVLIYQNQSWIDDHGFGSFALPLSRRLAYALFAGYVSVLAVGELFTGYRQSLKASFADFKLGWRAVKWRQRKVSGAAQRPTG